jgi:DNA-binding PadR family transcriptional regulator
MQKAKTRELNRFQYDALAAVRDEGPCSGAEVKEALERRLGKDVNHGRLYPNLDDLVERGLVRKRRNEPDNRTNQYEAKAEAEAALRDRSDWLGE